MGLYLLAVSRRDGGLEMNRVVRRFSKGNVSVSGDELTRVPFVSRARLVVVLDSTEVVCDVSVRQNRR